MFPLHFAPRRRAPVRHALLVLVVAIVAALPCEAHGQAARPGLHPRREIPGLDFHRDGVWRKRARQVAAQRAGMRARGQFGALNAPLAARVAAPSAAAVSGILSVPAILFKYADTPAGALPDTAAYNAALFAATPAPGRPYTYRSFYQQLSNGLLDIHGRTYAVSLDSAEVTYTGIAGTCNENPFGTTNCNGLFSSNAYNRLQNGLRESLARLDNSIDWTQFTSHGDTLDLVVFLQPAKDGACGGYPGADDASNNHIWSHRSYLDRPYLTHSGLWVEDYIIQSGLGGADFGCDTTAIMPIGTLAHETGHGFGLPDLYDTSPFELGEGIGDWGLMGEGNYTSALSPSRMEAWSLNELGWVTVAPLAAAGSHSFGAAPVSDTAFYVVVPGANPRGEYFLLENRQASQSDSAMIRIHCARSGSPPGCAGGLLVWHVDQQQITNGNASNTINTGAIHGLALVQADGRADLDAGTNRGDGGDPFPGVTGVAAVSAAKNGGGFAGFMIDLIQQVVPNGAMSFRLLFGAPALSTQAVVAQLLTGSGLTPAELSYLDVNGNHNSQFDLGDFLAWVNATGAP